MQLVTVSRSQDHKRIDGLSDSNDVSSRQSVPSVAIERDPSLAASVARHLIVSKLTHFNRNLRTDRENYWFE